MNLPSTPIPNDTHNGCGLRNLMVLLIKIWVQLFGRSFGIAFHIDDIIIDGCY